MHEVADAHLMEAILKSNDDLAAHNREHFDEIGLTVINLMSAPGAGKTTLLESTVSAVQDRHPSVVVEGDMVGHLDVERLSKLNIDAHQITTGRACHLDARMIARFLHQTPIAGKEFLFIENVGNLVCPAEFPLGEHKRVVLLSVTEGDDKPLKYPVIFLRCDALVFTKCDLLPYVSFDVEKASTYAKNLNPDLKIFAVSSKDSTGMDAWLDWILSQRATAMVQ